MQAKTHDMLTKRQIFGNSFQSLIEQLWSKESLFVFHRIHHGGMWKEITCLADYQKMVIEVEGSTLNGLWAVPEKSASFFTSDLKPAPPTVNPAEHVFASGKAWSIVSRPTEDYVLSCIMRNVSVLEYFK